MTCDSREVNSGSLFLGLPGVKIDGGIFWQEAFERGAVAAIIGTNAAKLNPPRLEDSVIVISSDISTYIGELASIFWGIPSSKMSTIGVTGTNGKTTVTHIIEHLSKSIGIPSALFGTIENRWPNHSQVASHTTPFSIELQDQMASALNAGSKLAVVEVSSHALDQNRVAGCKFSGAIFTNLTQDHLDYHSSMKKYFESKCKLFKSPLIDSKSVCTVVNIDNFWGEKLSNKLDGKCWRSSLDQKFANTNQVELTISKLINSKSGIGGLMHTPAGDGEFFSPLIGNFNLMNILQSVGSLLQLGLPLDKLLSSISDFKGVPGRMQRVSLGSHIDDGRLPTVVVDYAHTPDGLKNALLAAKPLVSGEVICVFGCGGDRDRGKRPLMGAVASKIANKIVITSDNPRSESPIKIINDIKKGISSSIHFEVEVDRTKAIQYAIDIASPCDVVLIAGKGHEDYQILESEIIHFDDREEVILALRNKSSN